MIATDYFEATQQKNGREKLPLWYLMRIVGNKSDILVRAVLDELLPEEGRIVPPASARLKSRACEIARNVRQNVGTAAIQRYVYPSVILHKTDGRKRHVRQISPLLTGYLFCKASEETLVALVNRVPNFIFCYPRRVDTIKRITVHDDEMARFVFALEQLSHDIQVVPLDEVRDKIRIGTEVRVVGGVLDGLDGVMTSRESKRHLYMQVGGSFVLSIELKRNDKTERKAQVQGLKVI